MKPFLLFGLIALASLATANPDESAVERLPFSSEETTGSLEVVGRHRVSWSRKTGEVRWDRVDLEIPQVARLIIDPGVWYPDEKESQTLSLRLDVRDGVFNTQLTLRKDETWTAPTQVRLGSRDLIWKEPRVDVRQISLAGQIGIDTRLTTGPLKTLKTLNLETLTVDSLQAGVYDARNLELRGAWDRPRWTLDRFEAEAFGGRLWAFGNGEWGTRERPLVSLEVGAEGIDLQDLLKTFKVARADQIEARVRGRVHLVADGRRWSVLDLDLVGEENTVRLSRELLYEILSPSLTQVLTRKQIDDALDSAFGPQEMIPFRELSFEGGLRPKTLNLRLPLENEVLDLDIEPQIDRELLWDIWDELAKIGMDNIRGLGGNGGAPWSGPIE